MDRSSNPIKNAGIYFIRRNKDGKRVLAMDDGGNVTTTDGGAPLAAGWEGIRITPSNHHGVYFLTRHKSGGNGASDRVNFAINNEGVPTKTQGGQDADGWEGVKIVNSPQDGVFFLIRNKDKVSVLAASDDGKVVTTRGNDPNGWEGWRLQFVQQ